MYECPNCGGNLKFNITAQQLSCAYCNAQFDPYEVTKEKDAEENTFYDVTVFTCPQCGGEIYSTDNTAAGFCSFCGASTVLDSRISRERRPGFIIPFIKTKEDCKKAYSKMIRHALFAPKELKNEKYIDSFRGIYMPYWVYYITQKGMIYLKGTKSHRSGDYIITDHYNLRGKLNNYYKGLSYDASSSFADNISERIAPFDVKNMKGFTPSFLSGFYADTADVDQSVYEEDAKEEANNQTKKYLNSRSDMKSFTLEKYNDLSPKYHTKSETVDAAMFPVWFLSYRNGDRVAYATVNGQTGKVVADLPVDIRKYMGGSLLLAIPVFLLLNFFFTFTPATVLNIVTLVSLLSIILHAVEMKQIVRKEEYQDDKGAMEAQRKRESVEMEAASAEEEMVKAQTSYIAGQERIKTRKAKDRKENEGKLMKDKDVLLIIGTFFFVAVVLVFGSDIIDIILGAGKVLSLIALIAAGIVSYISFKNNRKLDTKKKVPGFVGAFIAIVIAFLILLVNPVSDIFYYVGVIISLIAVFFTLLDLIRNYNILATRKLPQFDYKGGDDRA